MKKLFSALFAVVLLATSAFANGRDGGRQGSMSLTDTAVGLNVKTGLPMNGLLSYKNAMENDVANPKDLDYSVGSATNTLTVSRDATHPATYFDGNGVMQVTTTSDTARRSRGYYDETGWHSAPGWLQEVASTNLLIRTDGTASGSGLWTGWGTIGTCDNRTTTQVAIPELTSIAGANAQRVTGSFTVGDDDVLGVEQSPTGISNGDIVTLSGWVKGSVSGCTAKLVFYCWDAGYTNDCGSSVDMSTSISSSWKRFSKTITITNTAALPLVRLTIGDFSSGDSFDVQYYGIQLEKQAYPSSFIPTTTAALTRNAETTNTYTTAGNFPAPSGNNTLSFDGTNDLVTLGDFNTSFDGGTTMDLTVDVIFRNVADESDILTDNDHYCIRLFYGELHLVNQFQSGWDTLSTASTGFSVVANTKYRIRTVCDGTTKKIFVDGIERASKTINTTLGVRSGNTTLGYRIDNNDNFFDGIISYVSLTGASGLVAQYNFTDGTGTTLTDSSGNGNDGTISGATWSKDTHSGTIMLKYRPVMLPSEQSSNYGQLFTCGTLYSTGFALINMETGTNGIGIFEYSNAYAVCVIYSLPTWVRYQSHTIIVTWSTTSDSNGKKLNLYVDGISVGSSVDFMVPAGTLPASFSIGYSGQAMMLEEEAQWDRVLPQSEVTQIQNRS